MRRRRSFALLFRGTAAGIVALAAFTLILATGGQHAEAAFGGVTNGSFESPGGASGQINAGSSALTGWTVDGNVDYVCGGWQNADGNCALDMAATPSQGQISQVLSTTPGNHYTVTFMMAGNPGCSSTSANWVTSSWPLDEPGVKTLTVSATGTAASTYSFDVAGKSDTNMGWAAETYIFTATSTSTTLTFQNGTNQVCGAALDQVQITEAPAGPDTLGATIWQGQRPYAPVITPSFPNHGNPGFYNYIPGPVPGGNDAGWADCGPGNSLCPNANTIGLYAPNGSRLAGYTCLAAADFTFYQAFVSIPFGTTISQFSVNMASADDGARVAIYNSAHPTGFVFPGSYIYLGGAQSTTDMSSAMVAGEVNRVVITQMDDCYSGNNLGSAQIFLNGTVLPPTPSDTTPPVITVDVSGPMGDNGWYVGDVDVTWTVTDGESDVTSTTGCDATTISTDTAGVTLTCEATSAGGTASESVTIKRDATAPEATASRTPAANANGWNNTDVTVSFSGTDGLSGVASCDADVVLGEGAGQSASGTCTDNAGNVSAPASVGDINVDKTAPVVTITGTTDGASYLLGDEPTVGCSTSDALSGVDTEATATVAGGPVGTFTVTCDGATDLAGNVASATAASYTVTYDFCGFEQPLLVPVQTFKVGSTIPVKFCLRDASGASVTTAVAEVYANGVLQGTARYDGDRDEDEDGHEDRDHDDDGHYIFNLRTKGMTAGPLLIEVRLDDGTSYSIEVTLRDKDERSSRDREDDKGSKESKGSKGEGRKGSDR